MHDGPRTFMIPHVNFWDNRLPRFSTWVFLKLLTVSSPKIYNPILFFAASRTPTKYYFIATICPTVPDPIGPEVSHAVLAQYLESLFSYRSCNKREGFSLRYLVEHAGVFYSFYKLDSG